MEGCRVADSTACLSRVSTQLLLPSFHTRPQPLLPPSLRSTLPAQLYPQANPELLPSMDDLLGQHVDLKKVRKIGEGERCGVE